MNNYLMEVMEYYADDLLVEADNPSGIEKILKKMELVMELLLNE